MTICDKCKYRIKCRTKTGNAKNYCQYCGCLEEACHCSNPDIIQAKVSTVTLDKMGDCRTCKYKKKCDREMGIRKNKIKRKIKTDPFCGYCGCLVEVCHCSLPTGVHQEDIGKTGKGKRKYNLVKK